MKKIESKSLVYTQQQVTIGSKKRTVIVIGKKAGAKSPTANSKRVSSVAKTNKLVMKKKTCSGCSRKRRG